MNFNKLVYFLFLISVSKFSFSQLTKCKLQIKYIGDRMIDRQTDRKKISKSLSSQMLIEVYQN